MCIFHTIRESRFKTDWNKKWVELSQTAKLIYLNFYRFYLNRLLFFRWFFVKKWRSVFWLFGVDENRIVFANWFLFFWSCNIWFMGILNLQFKWKFMVMFWEVPQIFWTCYKRDDIRNFIFCYKFKRWRASSLTTNFKIFIMNFFNSVYLTKIWKYLNKMKHFATVYNLNIKLFHTTSVLI